MEYLNDVGCYVDKEDLPVDVSLTMDDLLKQCKWPYKGKLVYSKINSLLTE